MTDYILKAEPAVAVLTPYALARSAHHMYEMARAYDGGGDASGRVWMGRPLGHCPLGKGSFQNYLASSENMTHPP